MTSPHTTYAVILLGALAWCSAILFVPYLAASSSPFAVFVYQAFHHICHQLPERSFHLFGEKLAVCARCATIYFSFLIATTLFPFIVRTESFGQRSNTPSATPHRNILLLALLPMVIDVGLDFLGIHESTFATRIITGIIFGGVIPFFILPAAIEGVQQLRASRRRIAINEPT